MSKTFVDMDVFLRFLVNDDERGYKKARGLFEQAQSGTTRLFTTDMIITALITELESACGLGRQETVEVAEALMRLRNLSITNRETLKSAVSIYSIGTMPFRDAYNIALMRLKGIKQIATFSYEPYTSQEDLITL